MADHADPQAQLAEYESQLADVNEMLSADPNEESLLKLRDDLTELIALTKSELSGGGTSQHEAAEKPPSVPEKESAVEEGPAQAYLSSTQSTGEATETNASVSAAAVTKKKKKSKGTSVAETFEIPDHLKPLPSDTDAERKRKSRTVKALKSKWRERKKEAEGIEKQKSWQDFMGKKKKKGGSKRERSIFATEEGVNAKVGVISGTSGVRGNMTEFDGKKRHKH